MHGVCMSSFTPSRLLVAARTLAECKALVRDMEAIGCGVAGAAACHTVVHSLPLLEPDGVVMRIDEPDAGWFDALAEWADRAPCPLVVVAERSAPAQMQRAVDLGVHAWVVGDCSAQRMAAVWPLAQARWQRDTALRAQLEEARRQLDERKWVERAKGVLMAAREIGEEEAYRLLRNAAMQRQARLAEVSRTVIDASNWAEAINRAGQLRMLSQRLVRVFAQRLAKVGVRRAGELQDESMQRARENIVRLEALVPSALRHPALSAVVDAWQALQSVIEGRLSAVAVVQCDDCGETLLRAAEHLTLTLEAASGRRSLHVVNLSGRQRMLAQRVAKEVMLAAATVRTPSSAMQPVGLGAAMTGFETALAALESAPLSSDLARHSLTAARDEWGRLLRGLGAGDAEGRDEGAAASDALVQIFDRLTEHYQHSLLALMG